MDEIIIRRLECHAYHGVHPEEQKKGQKFYVSATLYTDTSIAAMSDNLDLTTNYSKVADLIAATMVGEKYLLIETVAWRIAEAVLLSFPRVAKIEVMVEKPEAPITHKFDNVAVKITHGWQPVLVAVGSNLGDSHTLIAEAMDKMAANERIRSLKTSALIESTPYGFTEQADFINGVAKFATIMPPHQLLDYLQGLEREAGRYHHKKNGARWQARALDLDILAYGDTAMEEERLVIPHPDMENRDFVLAPLASIDKYWRHPRSGLTANQMLANVRERHIIAG